MVHWVYMLAMSDISYHSETPLPTCRETPGTDHACVAPGRPTELGKLCSADASVVGVGAGALAVIATRMTIISFDLGDGGRGGGGGG
jgi:hypothetical protein